MRSAHTPLTGCIAAALCGLAAVIATVLATGCASQPAAPPDPNAGLLRDFLDGKFDGAGHPYNAIVVAAPCAAMPCAIDLPAQARTGELVVNTHLRVRAHGAGDIVQLSVGAVTDTLTAARLRGDDVDLPLAWHGDGSPMQLRVVPASDAVVEVSYVEVFPSRFGVVLAPGSGPIGDADRVTFELPTGGAIDRALVDGTDVTAQLAAATTTTTAVRTLVDIGVGQLAPARGDIAELIVHAGADAARMQLRRGAAPCTFEGDPTGAKVLVTGFQPFPADASHDNVSGVAVAALDPAALHGARVMKLVLPVEYDRAAAEVVDAIARCAPDLVLSFGQGGGAIALEEVAYNLEDTGEIAGGAPDNRGIVRAAVPIDAAAPATRDTRLPLDAIDHALVAAGETPQRSRDPGRYICNNVMFADLGTVTSRAGFIHLPYTDQFDDAVRARFANVVATAIQAAVDAP